MTSIAPSLTSWMTQSQWLDQLPQLVRHHPWRDS
jgi:hypothetical protein